VEVLPLVSFRETGVKPWGERVGIVFPIIAWGLPRTVQEFVSRSDFSQATYVFAVASCGSSAAGTLPALRRSLRRRGSDLQAGFIVTSPAYLPLKGPQAAAADRVRRLSGQPFPSVEERLAEIIAAVREKRRKRPERSAFLGKLLGDYRHRRAVPNFAKMDSRYKVGENCTGCGTCLRVCPRSNITREGGTTRWRGDCELCGACVTWCPTHAIGFGIPGIPPRPHNSKVSVGDFLLR
jgi:ferredoxin